MTGLSKAFGGLNFNPQDFNADPVETAYRNALAERFDACITLAATGPAPKGMLTGDPIFAVPGSMLAVPALSLPVFEVGGMPLGLQVLGFMGSDAAAVSVAGGLLAILQP